jgi:hypothetical protein
VRGSPTGGKPDKPEPVHTALASSDVISSHLSSTRSRRVSSQSLTPVRRARARVCFFAVGAADRCWSPGHCSRDSVTALIFLIARAAASLALLAYSQRRSRLLFAWPFWFAIDGTVCALCVFNASAFVRSFWFSPARPSRPALLSLEVAADRGPRPVEKPGLRSFPTAAAVGTEQYRSTAVPA